MSNTRFLGTTFVGGVRSPNYVNGRLLHAEDLRADQVAALGRQVSLGHALSPGIVDGLTVRVTPGSTNSLQVDPGLGLNPRGDLLQLTGSPATLSLVIEPETSTVLGTAGLFQACETAAPGENVVIDQGAYLLAVAPVARLEGSTPLQSAASRGNTTECAAKWQVEGLEFKAIRLSSFGSGGLDGENSPATRQNRLAHWCLGSQALATFPFSGYSGAYSGIDRLPASDLTPCDLPLAVFYWENGRVAFVDGWAARRRLASPFLATAWGGFFGQKRVAEGEARLLQFQEQLDGLLSAAGSGSTTLKAVDHFAHLPPLGFLPTTTLPLQALIGAGFRTFNIFFSGGNNPDSLDYPAWLVAWAFEPLAQAIGKASGAFVHLPTFWGTLLPEQGEFINLEQVDLLLERTRHQDAIDLVQAPAIKLYFIEEYVVLYMARLLLDGLSITVEGQTYDLLGALAMLMNFSGRDDNPQKLTYEEWFLRSLSLYYNLPLERLDETMARQGFPRVLFAKEFVAPASFKMDETWPTRDAPDVVVAAPQPRAVAAAAATPAVVALNARLARTVEAEPIAVARDLTATMKPATRATTNKRTQVFRRLKGR